MSVRSWLWVWCWRVLVWNAQVPVLTVAGVRQWKSEHGYWEVEFWQTACEARRSVPSVHINGTVWRWCSVLSKVCVCVFVCKLVMWPFSLSKQTFQFQSKKNQFLYRFSFFWENCVEHPFLTLLWKRESFVKVKAYYSRIITVVTKTCSICAIFANTAHEMSSLLPYTMQKSPFWPNLLLFFSHSLAY